MTPQEALEANDIATIDLIKQVNTIRLSAVAYTKLGDPFPDDGLRLRACKILLDFAKKVPVTKETAKSIQDLVKEAKERAAEGESASA